MAAPRCCTVVMNSPWSQASSDDAGHGLAVDLGVGEIGIHRGAMIAPDGKIRDGGIIHAGLLGELRLGAVFVERGHGEETFLRHAGALFAVMSELVLARIADNEHTNIARGVLAMALPWPVKIFPLMPSRSLRSIPALRGTAPTSSASSRL